MNNNITIIDGICGSGKTSLIVDKLKDLPNDERVIYISPYLDECHRIAGTTYHDDPENKTPDLDFFGDIIYLDGEPLNHLKFIHPVDRGFYKSSDLLNLLRKKENIVSTQALFYNYSEEVISLIKKHNYHLITDESLDLIRCFEIDYPSLGMARKVGLVTIDENSNLVWNDDNEFAEASYYQKLKQQCTLNRLFLFQKTVMWEYPIEVFNSFKTIVGLTYMFRGTLMYYYMKSHGIEAEVLYVYKDYNNNPITKEYDTLINLCDDTRMNSFATSRTALSGSWISKNKPSMKLLKNALWKYFNRLEFVDVKKRMWTSLLGKNNKTKKDLTGSGYTNSFVAWNKKATNMYKNKETLAFCTNVFLNPNLVQYLNSKKQEVDQELYALSEMLQWIFRSRLREGNTINIYVPSTRMRNLFKSWIKFETDKHNHYFDREYQTPNIMGFSGDRPLYWYQRIKTEPIEDEPLKDFKDILEEIRLSSL